MKRAWFYVRYFACGLFGHFGPMVFTAGHELCGRCMSDFEQTFGFPLCSDCGDDLAGHPPDRDSLCHTSAPTKREGGE